MMSYLKFISFPFSNAQNNNAKKNTALMIMITIYTTENPAEETMISTQYIINIFYCITLSFHWPLMGCGSIICTLSQYGWLIAQLTLSASAFVSSSTKLSTVTSPSGSSSVFTVELPVKDQLIVAAGLPLSALHTATFFSALHSIQADRAGGAEEKEDRSACSFQSIIYLIFNVCRLSLWRKS